MGNEQSDLPKQISVEEKAVHRHDQYCDHRDRDHFTVESVR